VINTAGYVKVDEAENETDKCYEINLSGALNLALACERHGVQFMTFSSDLVFDGSKGKPYIESDPVNPLNIYGKSKARAEKAVLKSMPGALIIRTSAFFGPWDDYNFVKSVMNALSENKTLNVAEDVFISPTYVPDLVNISLDLLIDNEKGIWHLTNEGEITWAGLAVMVANKAGLDHRLLKICSAGEMGGWKAKRPVYSALKSQYGILMPTLKNALNRYFEEIKTAPDLFFVENNFI
jgi:dTDP-4-dehydrorhamnose reductase